MAMPPRVEIRIRKSGIFVSLPTRMGRNTLSTMPITNTPYSASTTPCQTEPVTTK